MKTILRCLTSAFLIVILVSEVNAQDTTTINFLDQIKNYDLSTILTAESFLTNEEGNSEEKIKRAEIIGFIGDDFQRFNIHFVSIIQNPENPFEYLVYGKTNVKETICSFHGTMNITRSRTYKSGNIPNYTQGFANCEVILYEDKKQSSTGCIKGQLTSNFLVDQKGQFRYDAISFDADGFSNNQFIGSWTSYKTKTSKKCNWGDYRIPESQNLDIGAGEFSPADKYLKNGWENYRLAYCCDPEKPETRKARQKENEQWWK